MEQTAKNGDLPEIKITVLYDNYVFSRELKAEMGFSCLIEGMEKRILFDTGNLSDILLYNISQLNINLEDVNTIVISHNHYDHIGGLFSVLEKVSNVSVYLPTSCSDSLVKKIQTEKINVIRDKAPLEICRNAFLTGEMGGKIIEQSLILNTSKGMVLITGCAHPGIVNIIKKGKEILNKKIYLVLGGFHLKDSKEDLIKQVVSEFKSLDVINAAPSHCTGDKAISLFKETYGEHYIQLGVGKVLSI